MNPHRSSRFERLGRLAAYLAAAALVGLLALPLLALLLQAIEGDLAAQFFNPSVGAAIRLSLVTTLLSAVAIVLTGTPLAYLLARRRFRGRDTLDTLIGLPIVLPPAVAGLALLMAFGRRGLLGGALSVLGIALPFTTAAVVLAQVFVAAPFYVRAARVGFAAVPHELEEMAMGLGASGWQTFRRVTLPLSRRALTSGLGLAWARALGEFGATILFAGNLVGRTQTMPLAIYTSDLGAALAIAVLLVGVSLALLLLLRLVTRETSALD